MTMDISILIKVISVFLLAANAAAMLIYYWRVDCDSCYIVSPICEMVVAIKIFVSDVLAPTKALLYILTGLALIAVPLMTYAVWRGIHSTYKSKPDHIGEMILLVISIVVFLSSLMVSK